MTSWNNADAQAALRYRDERDRARNERDAANRRIAVLEAENAVLRRIFADAIDALPATVEETPCPNP